MASDRRAYVRIPDAILREPWDDATLADIVRLQAFLNTRWARDHLSVAEAGRAFLGPQEMMLITRVNNVTRARRRLLALQERSGGVTLNVRSATRSRCKGVIIEWPKFPIEQKYKDREGPQVRGNLGVTPPLPHPPPQPRTDTAERKERDPSDLAAPAAPWERLRNLRPEDIEKIRWERFLRDEYEVMQQWRHGQDPVARWPAVVMRFWNQRQARRPKTLEEVALEAQELYERDCGPALSDRR